MDTNGFTIEQLEDIVRMYELQVGIAKRRRPRDVSGASHTAPKEQLARLEAKLQRAVDRLENARDAEGERQAEAKARDF